MDWSKLGSDFQSGFNQSYNNSGQRGGGGGGQNSVAGLIPKLLKRRYKTNAGMPSDPSAAEDLSSGISDPADPNDPYNSKYGNY